MALLTGLNRNTVNRYVRVIQERIAEFRETHSLFGGEVEVDESFFGARGIKGKQGRGACGKTIVFGSSNRRGRSIRTCHGLPKTHAAKDYSREGFLGQRDLSMLARRTTGREPVGESAPRQRRGTPCHVRGF